MTTAAAESTNTVSTKRYYECKTVVPEYRGRKNVTLYWFLAGKTGRHYEELVPNWNELDSGQRLDAESVIDEYFDEAQVALLRDYLKGTYASELIAEEKELPVPQVPQIGIGACPVGGTTGFFDLDGTSEYDLPFIVSGFYNLEDHEWVNEPASPHPLDSIRPELWALLQRGLTPEQIVVGVTEILQELTSTQSDPASSAT
jgi:hypothetical protein